MSESASAISLQSRRFARLLFAAGNIFISLAAALSIRFLLIGGPTTETESATRYWGVVSYSVDAFRNAVLPSLVAWFLVLVIYEVVCLQ